MKTNNLDVQWNTTFSSDRGSLVIQWAGAEHFDVTRKNSTGNEEVLSTYTYPEHDRNKRTFEWAMTRADDIFDKAVEFQSTDK